MPNKIKMSTIKFMNEYKSSILLMKELIGNILNAAELQLCQRTRPDAPQLAAGTGS
jgi:hypothetical protein